MAKRFNGSLVLLSLLISNFSVFSKCTIAEDESGSNFPDEVCRVIIAFNLPKRLPHLKSIILKGKDEGKKTELAKLIAATTKSDIIFVDCKNLETETEYPNGKIRRIFEEVTKTSGRKVIVFEGINHLASSNAIKDLKKRDGMLTLAHCMDENKKNADLLLVFTSDNSNIEGKLNSRIFHEANL